MPKYISLFYAVIRYNQTPYEFSLEQMETPMTSAPLSAHAQRVQDSFIASLRNSARPVEPYRHWVLHNTLPAVDADAVYGLDVPVPENLNFVGKRDANNETRVYFNAESQARFPAVKAVAEAFQDAKTIAALEAECGLDLTGTNLRIEYCQDTAGFWLEPHTDIGAKKFTMLVYLSQAEDAETWGTDVYDADKKWFGRASGEYNSSMVFVPGSNTFHGFEERAINGVRKTIIINYVGPEWRARQELAFPETPVK